MTATPKHDPVAKHDPVDEEWAAVDADDWREAMALRSSRTTFYCRDGWAITFGETFTIPKGRDSTH